MRCLRRATAAGKPTLLPLSEIQFAAASPLERLVTYEAKWSTGSAADIGTQPRCPAEVEPHLAAEIRRVAIGAFQLAGFAKMDDCRGVICDDWPVLLTTRIE